MGLAVEWCVLISTLDDCYRYLTISSDLQLERYLLMRRANTEYVCMYVYVCMYTSINISLCVYVIRGIRKPCI